MIRPTLTIVSLGSAAALCLLGAAPAVARSDALPHGVSAWVTPTTSGPNVPPYIGFYANYQGSSLIVASVGTLSTQCSSGVIEANTGTMTSATGTTSTWTLTRSGKKLTVDSVGQVYSSTIDYIKYTPKKAAKLLKQGRKGNVTAKKLLAKCG